MRIRQVKPEFWTDELTADLVSVEDPALFYIGLWMQADDAGFIRWEPRRIAAELYPYKDAELREAAVLSHQLRLEQLRRLKVYKCGHAVLSKLTTHQHFAGETKRVYTYQREHARCSPRVPAGPRGSVTPSSTSIPAGPRGSPRPVRLGQVRLGQVNAQAHEENGAMSTIEQHDAMRKQKLSPEEQAQVWLDLWKGRHATDANRAAAEKYLAELGYRIENGALVKA